MLASVVVGTKSDELVVPTRYTFAAPVSRPTPVLESSPVPPRYVDQSSCCPGDMFWFRFSFATNASEAVVVLAIVHVGGFTTVVVGGWSRTARFAFTIGKTGG